MSRSRAGIRSVRPSIRARTLKTLRDFLRAGIGLVLLSLSFATLFPSSSAQATPTQPTSFSILVNGATSATIPTTGAGSVTLSETGLLSTTVGEVEFFVNGDTNCQLNLTGMPDEGTSCTAEPFSSSGPGTYVVTATFFDLGDNGNEFTLASSNSATLTISGQTSFTISVNQTSSATIPPGASANFTLTGLPWSVAGSVTYSAGGTVLCTESVSYDNQPGCYSSPSLPQGTYQVSATFVDTDGTYLGSQSSNSVTLSVSTQTSFTISILKFWICSVIVAVDYAKRTRQPFRDRTAFDSRRNGDIQCQWIGPLRGDPDGRIRGGD